MFKTTARKRQYSREWQKANRDKLRITEANYRQNLKIEMILAYGRTCKHCGEDDPLVLVLDHIFDNAQEDRKANKHHGGYRMYAQLKKKGWPKDQHQLLCQNCNFRKELIKRNAQRK